MKNDKPFPIEGTSDDTNERMKFVIESLVEIKKLIGLSGYIVCPKCGGELYWTRASSNGHIWGKCRTEGCLQWMQ